MRILQLIAGLDIGGAHGGAERFGLELACALAQRGHAVRVCAFWQRGTPAELHWRDELSGAGIEVFFAVRRSSAWDLSAYLRGARAVLRRYARGDLEVVHSHFQWGSLLALGLRAAGRTRCAVRTAHVTCEWGPGALRAGLRGLFNGWLFPLLLDGEAGVSQAVVANLSAHPGSRLARRDPRLIPNAIRLPDDAPPRVYRQEGPFLILSAGRLTAQKDFSSLLAAFALLADDLPGARLALAGEGRLGEALRDQARRLGIEQRVDFLGTRSDLEQWMARADLFVLPSRYEGLPTVLLECMARGLPVVASDIPGTRELVTHGVNGWLAQPGSPAGLAAAIGHALLHPGLRQPAASAGLQIAAGHSIQSAAQEYERFYRSILPD